MRKALQHHNDKSVTPRWIGTKVAMGIQIGRNRTINVENPNRARAMRDTPKYRNKSETREAERPTQKCDSRDAAIGGKRLRNVRNHLDRNNGTPL